LHLKLFEVSMRCLVWEKLLHDLEPSYVYGSTNFYQTHNQNFQFTRYNQ